MGCGEECPYYAGASYEDWELDDPKGQDEATVRRIVADIDQRVRRCSPTWCPTSPCRRQSRATERTTVVFPPSAVPMSTQSAGSAPWIGGTTLGPRPPGEATVC